MSDVFKFRTTNERGDDLEVSRILQHVLEVLPADDGTAMIKTQHEEWRRTCEPFGVVAARLSAARLAAGLPA